ncbi:hypothetical protein AMECASPLE_027368 [Ameca splendens]|uniref:Uncharacterized protein n=1 Tax=Ameca splendens TaxID=208324 RepID=A0ABV0ZRE0_9TELE
MNFDQILSAIGGFGKYQKILYIWICLPQILLAFHMMVSIFTGATPPYRCRESSSSGAENQTLLLDAGAGNLSLSESSCFSSQVLLLQDNLTERVPCAHGWVYRKETFQSTTVTEVLRMIRCRNSSTQEYIHSAALEQDNLSVFLFVCLFVLLIFH